MDFKKLVEEIEKKNIGVKTITITAIEKIEINGLMFRTTGGVEIRVVGNDSRLTITQGYDRDKEIYIKIDEIKELKMYEKSMSYPETRDKYDCFFSYP